MFSLAFFICILLSNFYTKLLIMPKIILLKSFTICFKSIKNTKVIDFFAVLILSSIAIIISMGLSSNCPDIFYIQNDVWYGADISRTYANMINSGVVSHYRTHVHPIFSLLIVPLIKILVFFGFSALNAAYILIALSGAVVVSTLFLTLRFSGFGLISSLLGSFIFLSSGSFIFWWSVVETFPIGGASISIIFLLIAMRNKSIWIWTIGAVFTLSITITNWAVGIIGSFLIHSRITAIKVLIISFAVVLSLYFFQIFILDIKSSHIDKTFEEEFNYIEVPESLTNFSTYMNIYLYRSVTFFVYPAVVSKVIVSSTKNGKSLLEVRSEYFKYNVFGWVSIICWFTLLCGGIVKIFRKPKTGKLAKTLIIFILYQFLLHMFYGDGPFLYSSHYIAALVIMASYSLHGKYAKVFQLVAVIFCINAMYSNLINFNHAIELLNN